MKRYSNIPLKERKRNADRVYRHEEKLDEIAMRKLVKGQEKCKRESECITDKDRDALKNNEVYARLKAIERGGV
jgi:hypothetical protein